MPWLTLPTVSNDQAVRTSWGNAVKNNDDDHETRIVALESGGGTGDVVGPASAVDNAIARFNTGTGKLIQNSGITIADGASGALSGTNSGDVTLAGTPNYLSIAAQVITQGLINLASHITGRLPYANLTASTSANRLLGRGSSGGAGDWQEIALGSNLSMSGSTLNATGGGGGGALDDLSDVIITTPATNDVIQYNGSSFVNQPAANLNATNLTAGTVAAARMPALTGDVTTSAGSVATTIANDAVSYAKMQNVSAASRLLGRGSSGGSGDTQEISLGTGLSMSGTTLAASGAGAAQNIGITIDGGGSTITTGVKGFIEVPFSGTIVRATLLSTDAAVTSGSIVIDVWKDTYANYPPVNADSITASAPPTISSSTKSQDSTLTGWTTAVTAGDILGFNVDSVTSLTRVTLILTIQ